MDHRIVAPGKYRTISSCTSICSQEHQEQGMLEHDPALGPDEPSDKGSMSTIPERASWSSKVEFMLSCLSYAVGLGNIWRFPYLCYRNGGGAFLVPYVIMMMTTGLPLFFFELSMGQFAGEGPITMWKVCPLFQGIGYAMFVISILVGIYYNMILAWAIFYLASSFTDKLPWSSCDNWWNTEACRKFDSKNCTVAGGLMNSTGACIFQSQVDNDTWFKLNETASKLKMPADEYFHNYMLDISNGIHDMGEVRWQLALCLALAWIIVFFALLKGVKSFGKAVYFTALFPYVVLVILLVRAATLPGYLDGIFFYLNPRWEKLKEARVWADAAIQIFFSLGPCWGGLITLSSYNSFRNNCFRDAIVIGTGNCVTSFFAGFVIFGIVGFMAHELGVPVDKVADQGAGLAFIAYPEAVARLPLSPMWSFLFFFMLLTLGMGTQFTVLETVVTTIVDEWPQQLRKNHKWVLLGCSIFMYLCGLTMTTRGGMYVLQLTDNHAASFSALIIGCTEVLVVAWIYGAEKFLDDIKLMLGHYPFHYRHWQFTWRFLTPALLLGILIFSWIDYTPNSYGNYEYPFWANALGWGLTFLSVLMVPAVMVWKILKLDGPLIERIKYLSRPTPQWGPREGNKSSVEGGPESLPYHVTVKPPTHTDSCVPLTMGNAILGSSDNKHFMIEEEEAGLTFDKVSHDSGDGLKFKELPFPNGETGL